MSHFSVIVITRKNPSDEEFYGSNIIDLMLAPYNEGLTVLPYVGKTKEQYIKEERERLEDYKNTRYAEYLKNPEEYEKKSSNAPGHLEYIKNFMSEYNKTDEELISEWHSRYPHYNDTERDYGEAFFNKDGDLVTYYNKYAKWDWYVIGGRWENTLKLHDGSETNCSQIKNIDFGIDVNIEELAKDPKTIEKYEKLVTDGDGVYRSEYFKGIYPTIEDYIRNTSYLTSFAVIDADGIWHQLGEMGWFGCSSETPEDHINWVGSYYETFFKNIPQEWYATIVDCHI